MDAARALLVQNLMLTWRYSVGNPYEQFSFPEGVDVAQVLGELRARGRRPRDPAHLARRGRTPPYPNWKMGEKLLGSATHFRLFRDRAFVGEQTPGAARLRRDARAADRQKPQTACSRRERYSSDIQDPVYGLHSQAVVWAGLRGMAAAWAVDRPARARGRAPPRSLRGSRAVCARRCAQSQRRLPDGSLFVPVRLLGDEAPYRSLIEARLGQLLEPRHALRARVRPLRAAERRGATAIWRYMQLHGSRLLGLVRAGAYALYGREAPFPASGTDQVYGINVSRFLADRGERRPARAEPLRPARRGHDAGDVRRRRGGERRAASPGSRPARCTCRRTAAANAAFLETLRLLLVHETRGDGARARAARRREPGSRRASGSPSRTPRRASGRSRSRSRTHARYADVVVTPPRRSQPRTLRLRLRLPPGTRIASVTLDGRPYGRFDAAAGTIDLSGRRGTLQLRVGFRKSVA